jgi:hypothetical protein
LKTPSIGCAQTNHVISSDIKKKKIRQLPLFL